MTGPGPGDKPTEEWPRALHDLHCREDRCVIGCSCPCHVLELEEWRIYDRQNDRTHTGLGLLAGDWRDVVDPLSAVALEASDFREPERPLMRRVSPQPQPLSWLPTLPGTYLEFAATRPARARPCWSCRWGPRRWARRRHWGCGPPVKLAELVDLSKPLPGEPALEDVRARVAPILATLPDDPAAMLEALDAPRGQCEACGAAEWRYFYGAWACGRCGQTPGGAP